MLLIELVFTFVKIILEVAFDIFEIFVCAEVEEKVLNIIRKS